MTTTNAVDGAAWQCHLRIDKFRATDLRDAEYTGLRVSTLEEILVAGIAPYGVVEVEPANVLTAGGVTTMLSLLTMSASVTPTSLSLVPYSLATARICVGDGNGSVPTITGDPTSDTTLVATTNRYNQAVQASTGVAVSANVVTFTAVFGTGVANYAWNEWGIDSGGTSGSGAASGLLNHKGVYLGTKTSAASWTATATITIT